MNNEVGTMLARAYAAFKHGIEVDWDDFAYHQDAIKGVSPSASSVKEEDGGTLKIK